MMTRHLFLKKFVFQLSNSIGSGKFFPIKFHFISSKITDTFGVPHLMAKWTNEASKYHTWNRHSILSNLSGFCVAFFFPAFLVLFWSKDSNCHWQLIELRCTYSPMLTPPFNSIILNSVVGGELGDKKGEDPYGRHCCYFLTFVSSLPLTQLRNPFIGPISDSILLCVQSLNNPIYPKLGFCRLFGWWRGFFWWGGVKKRATQNMLLC